jgi:signal transduction histidine kinase/ligand-binding sensor domain-containing protein
MGKIVRIIHISILVLLSLHFNAQLSPARLKYFGEPAGSAVYDVLADRMGNIWIATQNGLVQFNGYEFKRYYPDPNDSTSIGSILTYRLHEDRKGNIWIGSLDNLCVYHPGSKTFKSYPYLDQTDFPITSQSGISVITADTSGKVYFGITSFINITGTHSILYYDEKEDRIKRLEYDKNVEVENIYSATSDQSGNVWFISHNGFFKVDRKGTLMNEPMPEGLIPGAENYYFRIASDKNGTIWMASDQDNQPVLLTYDPLTSKYKSRGMSELLTGNNKHLNLNQITVDQEDNIWLATSRGLVFYDRQKDEFSQFEDSPDHQPEHTEIYCLEFDSFGNLWYGTSTNGIVKYDTRSVLRSITSTGNGKNSIPLGWTYRIYEASDQKVWIATFSGNGIGMYELFPGSQSLVPHFFEDALPENTGFTGFTEERPGEFLASSGWQFYNYSTRSRVVKKVHPEGFPDSIYVNNIIKDGSGNIWFCTNNSLYEMPATGGAVRHIDLGMVEGSNPSSEDVVNVFEGKKHGLWILTNNGLFLYDPVTGKVNRHGYDRLSGDIFSSQDINSFYEDYDGICWIGTWQGGLSRYDPVTGKIKTYTLADGLPSMSVQGILEDENNKSLWISTFEGISKFNKENSEFVNFSLEDGIQGLMYADGAYLKTSGGYFIFGGNNGITIFKPEEVEKNSIPPKVYITDFKVADKSLATGPNSILNNNTDLPKELKLKYRQNSISIDYLGIHYANPARNKFAYKLENYDDDWRQVGNVRTAYYYNLPPGEYIFHVKAANSNGIWNEEGASLNIRISPPWSRTWLAYLFYGICLVLLIITADRFQRKRVLLKERILAKEKEIEHGREIAKAFTELKATQAQLIQSEKMASLGELTAGIAHEIQNPLNFVNNFSEVTIELLEELTQESAVGGRQSAVSSQQSGAEIIDDIKQNLEKIIQHGKRADAIVKGMLQHSRTSTGKKELTDINILADEYLRLSYHGLRAKDKTFNADFKTVLDPDLPKINVIPQDIGRVLLNLINNAFYAVSTRNLSGSENLTGLQYKPTVIVSTKNLGSHVEISVQDNGNGIPAEVKDKIFQPFFTTKPTGEGTGLGLSLSYDIVRTHGGELKVETKEGEGSVFIIQLPVIIN